MLATIIARTQLAWPHHRARSVHQEVCLQAHGSHQPRSPSAKNVCPIAAIHDNDIIIIHTVAIFGVYFRTIHLTKPVRRFAQGIPCRTLGPQSAEQMSCWPGQHQTGRECYLNHSIYR